MPTDPADIEEPSSQDVDEESMSIEEGETVVPQIGDGEDSSNGTGVPEIEEDEDSSSTGSSSGSGTRAGIVSITSM